MGLLDFDLALLDDAQEMTLLKSFDTIKDIKEKTFEHSAEFQMEADNVDEGDMHDAMWLVGYYIHLVKSNKRVSILLAGDIVCQGTACWTKRCRRRLQMDMCRRRPPPSRSRRQRRRRLGGTKPRMSLDRITHRSQALDPKPRTPNPEPKRQKLSKTLPEPG